MWSRNGLRTVAFRWSADRRRNGNLKKVNRCVCWLCCTRAINQHVFGERFDWYNYIPLTQWCVRKTAIMNSVEFRWFIRWVSRGWYVHYYYCLCPEYYYYYYRSTSIQHRKCIFNIYLEKERKNWNDAIQSTFGDLISHRGRIFQFPSIDLISVRESVVCVCAYPVRLDSMIIIIIRWEEFSRIDEFELKWKKTSCRRNGKKRNKHEWQTAMPRCAEKKQPTMFAAHRRNLVYQCIRFTSLHFANWSKRLRDREREREQKKNVDGT